MKPKDASMHSSSLSKAWHVKQETQNAPMEGVQNQRNTLIQNERKCHRGEELLQIIMLNLILMGNHHHEDGTKASTLSFHGTNPLKTQL